MSEVRHKEKRADFSKDRPTSEIERHLLMLTTSLVRYTQRERMHPTLSFSEFSEGISVRCMHRNIEFERNKFRFYQISVYLKAF